MSDSEFSAQVLAEACAKSLYSGDNATQSIGAELVSIEPGKAVMSMQVREDMLNGHKICHGGFIFTLADTAFAFSCNSRNVSTVTQGCNIDYMRPARLGETLTAVAQEKFLAGRSGLYDVTVCNDKGEGVAYFRGKSCSIKGAVLVEAECA